MFSEISFPDGWMETTNYSGVDVKMLVVDIQMRMVPLGQVNGATGVQCQKFLATHCQIPVFSDINGIVIKLSKCKLFFQMKHSIKNLQCSWKQIKIRSYF